MYLLVFSLELFVAYKYEGYSTGSSQHSTLQSQHTSQRMSSYNFDSTTSPTNYAPPPNVMDGVPPLQFWGNALTSEETPRGASYRDGGGFMYVDYYSHGYIDVGVDTSYRPTTTLNNSYPSQGTAWTATTVPQAGNVEEMAGYLTGVQTPFDASQVASTSSTLPSRTPGIRMASHVQESALASSAQSNGTSADMRFIRVGPILNK